MAAGIVTDVFIDALRARVAGLRLLTDETDRETYRRDETAYLPAGLPGAVALPAPATWRYAVTASRLLDSDAPTAADA